MRLIPSKRVIEKFLLIYELKGCQKAVDFLTKYYRIRRMNIVVNGRKVGNGDLACYDCKNYVAYFSKRGLNEPNVLHELYHHIVHVNDWIMSDRTEEKKANSYTKRLLNVF